MAAKKKTKKKSTKSKKTARKISAAPKSAKRPKRLAKKTAAAKTLKKSAKKSATKATKKPAKKKVAKATTVASQKLGRQESPRPRVAAYPYPGRSSGSGGQAGDLQGLSRSEAADSESVDELVEEGNAFEADAVQGVEDADNSDEQEVHTHEVPEDDVPGEYLDKD